MALPTSLEEIILLVTTYVDKRIADIRGEKGDKGDKGERGANGIRGPSGKQGPVGKTGPTGRDGLKGENGKDGKQGPRGPRGAGSGFGPIGGGAPTDIGYLISAASPNLPNGVVVGTTPGGELGGTHASPTVDATHSGSTHAATQAAAEATAAAALATHAAREWNGTQVDVLIDETTDVPIISHDMTALVAGEQLEVVAWFTVLNNSGATRVCTFTLDFDGRFDMEFDTGALANHATEGHPFRMMALLSIRASNLAFMEGWLQGGLAAGSSITFNPTTTAGMLSAMGWSKSTQDLTGTTSVTLHARSADGTADQTLQLHSFHIRRMTPN